MRTLLGLIIANSLQLQISHANAPWNIQPSPNENSQFSSIFNQKYAKPGSSKKVNSCAKKSDWSSDYGYLPKIIRNGTYKFLELVPDTNKNFVFSPLSIFSAMGLLVRGTKGVSTSELVRSMSMEREIEFDKNARLRTGGIFKFKRMLHQFANTGPVTSVITQELEGVQYKLNNAIFINSGLEFTESYGKDVRKVMLAKANRIDFTNAAKAKSDINGWFSKRTNGKINEMVQELDTRTQMVLANALYFKAPWQAAFSEYMTIDYDFRLSDGSSKTVKMMRSMRANPRQTTSYAVLPDNLGDALRMELGPYNCKSQFGITFFRPESYSKIDQLQAWLSKNSETGEIFRNSVHPPVSKIYLPKFKVEREIDLMETLKKLGVESVFDFSKADFSEMVLQSDGLAVTAAKHKAVFEIDEGGVEGSAATAIMIGARSMGMNFGPTVEFILDRPFMFMLTELSTDLVLFIGRINSP